MPVGGSAVRIVGKQGSIYYAQAPNSAFLATDGSMRVADLFNWEMEVIQDLYECSVKGDVHEVYAPGRVMSRVTAERLVQNVSTNRSYPYTPAANATNAAAAMLWQIIHDTPNSTIGTGNDAQPTKFGGLTIQFVLYGVDTPRDGTNPVGGSIIQGEGFLQRVQHRSPRTTSQEQFEIVCTKLPIVAN